MLDKLPCTSEMREICKVVLLDDDEVHVGDRDNDDHSETSSFSRASSGSLCSPTSDPTDDATSSPSSRALSLDPTGGPLYELSPLLAQLPVRRGLSKYYQGKSQSFTSLSDATSAEDLAKRAPYSRRMKNNGRSHAAGLDMSPRRNRVPGPRGKTIAKKPSRGSFACMLPRTGSATLLHGRGKPPACRSKNGVHMHASTWHR